MNGTVASALHYTRLCVCAVLCIIYNYNYVDIIMYKYNSHAHTRGTKRLLGNMTSDDFIIIIFFRRFLWPTTDMFKKTTAKNKKYKAYYTKQLTTQQCSIIQT